ncbi:oligodendrocyte-myelin glycoprotein-like [Anguilla anguilla]|uniref:oligodendrocyte-myelin glycoprotein-like n=1 Tax=Anguilla anguilla TaxID=7936 RepID=UPI0015A87827|nr:oligodendrocyte-myelin glycoprotein-like [Anguilla anguilla]
MKRTRRALTMRPWGAAACALLLLFGLRALAVCPHACSCTRSHRVADCSGRGLDQLPDGLQHNVRTLNLSRNRLQDLDGLLGHLAHLRTLDISRNHLARMPAGLPRALWEILASGNRLRMLEKNDTAYQWNLRALDLSANQLERVVFINNTLPDLRLLNLSHNKFWTVPTNMPSNLETVDLSHNFLVQILPGSLDRLPRLSRFYLHGNRFSSVGEPAFGRLEGLRLITLDDNPWACEDEENITGLLAWTQRTSARVLGCPCHTRHVCGEARAAATGAWRYASFTRSPLEGEAAAGRWSKPAAPGLPDEGPSFPGGNGTSNFSLPANHLLFGGGGFSTVATTTTSATPRSRAAEKAKAGGVGSANAGLRTRVPNAIGLNVLLATVVFGEL